MPEAVDIDCIQSGIVSPLCSLMTSGAYKQEHFILEPKTDFFNDLYGVPYQLVWQVPYSLMRSFNSKRLWRHVLISKRL